MSHSAMPDDAKVRLYPWYVLALLTLAVILSYIDRYVLAVLVQPIKAEMGFSDTQLGLLTGFAFAAFYAALGVPIARIADRSRRRLVIVASLVTWSSMTALCGAASGFLLFAIARFGVGAGEAGALPASQSLVATYFPNKRRNTAFGLLASGGGIGLLLAFLIGGPLEAVIGWRWTFVMVALPGIVLAVLIHFTLAEPTAHAGDTGTSGSFSLWNAFRDDPLFRHVPLAQATLALLTFAQSQWLPAYFERAFDLARPQVGPMLALTNGFAAIVGIVGGGMLGDRLAGSGRAAPMRLGFLAVALSGPAMLALYLAQAPQIAFIASALVGLFLALPGGLMFALVQGIVPGQSRATAAASVALFAALLGLGAGPLIIGAGSDLLAPTFGAQSLRWSLLATTMAVLPWCLFHFYRVIRLLGERQSI